MGDKDSVIGDDCCPASSLHTVSVGSMKVESLIDPKRAEKSSEYDSMGGLEETFRPACSARKRIKS